MTDTTDLTRREAGRRRIEAVRAQLEQQELDVLLVFGSGRHHFLVANPCWWLSGTRQLGREALVAVTREGESVLVTSPRWDEARSRRRGWISDVVAVDDVGAALPELVRRRGWHGARVGVAGGETLSLGTAAALERAFERPPVLADDALAAVTAIHDDYAMSLIERGVEIAEAGYRHLLDVAAPGMREFELHAEVDAYMRDLGADDIFMFITGSQHNHGVHPPTDRELGVGDVVMGEISPSVDGQFAQICRSAVIGEPSAQHREAYDVLREGFQAGIDLAAPGVSVADLTRAINAVIAAHGYGTYNYPPYMRTRGHAMGLGALVPLDVSERSEVILAPGMSFVLHPNQYFPGPGYFLCGDQIVITQDGVRVLADGIPQLGTIDAKVAA